MYGDGRILSIVKGQHHRRRAGPLRVEPGGPDSGGGVRLRGAGARIVDPAEDFGMPGVTDMDATTVLVHGEGAPAKVGVYAFCESFDKGLTVEQQRARATLRQVIDAATNLAAVGTRAPYTPDRIAVFDVGTGRRASRRAPLARAAAGRLPQARPAGPGAGLRLPHRRTGDHGVQGGADQPRRPGLVDGAARCWPSTRCRWTSPARDGTAALTCAGYHPNMRVAIVGGGAAGVLTAAHLRRVRPDAQITLIDSSGRPGTGAAYGTGAIRCTCSTCPPTGCRRGRTIPTTSAGGWTTMPSRRPRVRPGSPSPATCRTNSPPPTSGSRPPRSSAWCPVRRRR